MFLLLNGERNRKLLGKLGVGKMEKETIPEIYMPEFDEVRKVDQAWVDKANLVGKRQHNRNYLIITIANLNILSEDDMSLMLRVQSLFADRDNQIR